MRKFASFICTQIALLGVLVFAQGACPSPIDPLPTLPVPYSPSSGLCSTPAQAVVAGYMPISFVNGTGLPADEVFIVVLVNSSTGYLSFTTSGSHLLGAITSFTPFTYLSSMSSPQYTYKLTDFELTDTDTYTFYIPNDGNTADPTSNFMTSSRILVSLKEPLTYFIDNLGHIGFPSEFDVTNDNYFILNDKIEFDLGSNGLNRLNMNLTWVDFFGIPFLVQASYKFFLGTMFTDACAVTGMPTTVSLSDAFTGYDTALTKLVSPFDTHWGGLVAKYTNPPPSGLVSHLRIFAPATAMGSTQTQSNPTTITFPTDYFLQSATTPDTCSWFNAVWSGKTLSGKEAFYQNNKPKPYLVLDATTKAGSATATGSEHSDGSFRFKIAGGPDGGKTVTFPKPCSSKAFFTGATADYDPPISSAASAATVSQVLKVFATSIISGFFPLDCRSPEPIKITNSYVQGRVSDYFQNNAILTSALDGCSCLENTPWYDFYSRTFLTIGSPNLFYTSAYSDFLGADGTIVIVNLMTDNADATITVNLNDCSTGINFPDPYADTTMYTLTVDKPPDTIVEVKFGTTITGPFGAIPAMVDGDEFFLEVTYKSGIYSGKSFVTQIAPLAQIFHPILPGQGTVSTTGTSTTVSIGASPAG